MTVADDIQRAAVTLSKSITSALKELLETKHLYQSIVIPFNDNMLKAAVSQGFKTELVETDIGKLYGGPWHVWQLSEERNPFTAHLPSGLAFRVPHVKIFCQKCDRREAFNYLLGLDILEPCKEYMLDIPVDVQPTIQIFVLSFLCQSCKSIPEVFLVRREAHKLTLSGRSPIEHVEKPRFIPKTVARFFSGAIVAHQSGQTLAGVFLFRVLIEQWVLSQAKIKGLKVDQTLDEYMDGLPKDFKERFPSFRTLYEKLSADIHNAMGSAELFEEARLQIVEHFDARRLFKLS